MTTIIPFFLTVFSVQVRHRRIYREVCLKRGPQLKAVASDIQKIAVSLQRAVCIVSKNPLCKNLAKLNAFLIEAV